MRIHNLIKAVLGAAGFVAFAMFAPTAFGQAAPQDQSAPAHQGAGMHGHEDPYADLNLTDDQKMQIKKIHMDAKAKAEAVKADSSLSDADKEAKIKEIHRATRMEADKVLTPEQRAQLKDKMKEHKAEKSQPPA